MTTIASEILSIIDDNKHLIQDQTYISMCNYLQSQYKFKNNRIALTDAIHNFNIDDKVFFNRLDGTVVNCQIVNVERDIFPMSYDIKIENNDSIIKTISSRLFKLHSDIRQTEIDTETVEAIIPEPHVKTPCKVFIDIKYRQFINEHSRVKKNDVHTVLISLGIDCENNGTSIINKEQELINNRICDESELKILYINQRNKRCRTSHEYIFIKKEYERILGKFSQLAF